MAVIVKEGAHYTVTFYWRSHLSLELQDALNPYSKKFWLCLKRYRRSNSGKSVPIALHINYCKVISPEKSLSPSLVSSIYGGINTSHNSPASKKHWPTLTCSHMPMLTMCSLHSGVESCHRRPGNWLFMRRQNTADKDTQRTTEVSCYICHGQNFLIRYSQTTWYRISTELKNQCKMYNQEENKHKYIAKIYTESP